MKDAPPLSPLNRSLGVEEQQSPLQKSGGQLRAARRRFPLNIFSNIVWVVINIIAGFWYTPYLIDHLGVAVYGLTPLVTSVVAYMSILTTGLNDAIGRFLTINLANNDTAAANRTFNTAIVGSLLVIAILAPATLMIAYFAPHIFDIPAGYEFDAQLLILLTAAAFLLTAFASIFAISSYAYHRFDLRFLVNVARLATQYLAIIALFNLLRPNLWQVGVGVFLSATIFLFGHQVLWRKLTPQLKLQFRLFDPSHLKELLSFSGWVLVNMLGALLFLNIDLILVNMIFGADVAGHYGAVIIFPTSLRAVIATINGVLSPIILTIYAKGNKDTLVRFSRLSVKFLGLMVALPIGILIGLGKPLLILWLGPEFADLSLLIVALVAHLSVSLAVTPLFSLQITTGNVRLPGLVSLAAGIGNALLSTSLALWSGWGYISIAIATAIMLLLKNAIFTPLYGASILRKPWWTFFPSLVPGIGLSLALGLGAYWLSLHWRITTWGELFAAIAGLSVIYAGVSFSLGLSTDDRSLLFAEIKQRARRT